MAGDSGRKSRPEIPAARANSGLAFRVVRAGLRAAGAISPRLAARAAVELWFRPPHLEVRPELKAFLATGQRETMLVHGRPVAVWRWGHGPAVILAHGWGGYGAQMQPFVAPLVASGFQAIVFDAPAHGESGPSQLGKGKTTLFDFGYVIDGIGKSQSDVAGVVAHSGGATAVAWILQTATWKPRSLVFIAPMASAMRYKNLFHMALGLDDSVLREFDAYTEGRFDFRWSDFEVPQMAARMRTPPLLVVHDRGDTDTAWEEGAAIVGGWPRSVLKTTDGLGHRRILKDPDVVAAAVDFVKAQAGGPVTPSGHPGELSV